jgi:hypothetical protein
MKVLHALMRAYAYLFHLGNALFLTGLAGVAYLTGTHNLNSGGMVSYSGKELTQCLLGIGLTGIVCVLAGVTGKLKWLFPVYAIGAAFTMFRWFFTSGYHFGSQEAFQWGVAFFAGAIGAMLCSFLDFKTSKKARR